MSNSNDNHIQYTLTKGFQYDHHGERQTATFIILDAPTIDNLVHVAQLKQGFMRAISYLAKNSSNQASSEKDAGNMDDMNGATLMTALAGSSIDYSEYLNTAKEVLKKIALVEGEEKLTDTLLREISIEDFEGMVGEYLKVFILGSALKVM